MNKDNLYILYVHIISKTQFKTIFLKNFTIISANFIALLTTDNFGIKVSYQESYYMYCDSVIN